MKGEAVSSLSSCPQFPSIRAFLTTMPSLSLGFMWKAMSLDRLAFRLMENLSFWSRSSGRSQNVPGGNGTHTNTHSFTHTRSLKHTLNTQQRARNKTHRHTHTHAHTHTHTHATRLVYTNTHSFTHTRSLKHTLNTHTHLSPPKGIMPLMMMVLLGVNPPGIMVLKGTLCTHTHTHTHTP